MPRWSPCGRSSLSLLWVSRGHWDGALDTGASPPTCPYSLLAGQPVNSSRHATFAFPSSFYRQGGGSLVTKVFIWRKILNSLPVIWQLLVCLLTAVKEASIPMGLSVSVIPSIRNLGHKAKRPRSVTGHGLNMLWCFLCFFFFIDLSLMKSGVLLC